jgi:putative acetyltransferase
VTVHLRQELPEDAATIREVQRLAFGRACEADLVGALREAGAAVLSLVAVDLRVQGHVLFTRVTVSGENGEESSLLGLGPVAVTPARQGEGIGTMLIEAGLERMRGGDYPAVVVLGSPRYYSRFGFVPASSWGLRYGGDAPEEAFMALELTPGSLVGVGGAVCFRPEFAGVWAKRMGGRA